MACPTCNGHGYLEVSSPTTGYPPPYKEPCPNPDCPDRLLGQVTEMTGRVTKNAKVVNLAPNQNWSGVPVLFTDEQP